VIDHDVDGLLAEVVNDRQTLQPPAGELQGRKAG